MTNPFAYTPDEACREAFRKLIASIEADENPRSPEEANFRNLLKEGKMLGVLIAEDPLGNPHALYAFSGQLGTFGFNYPGFVGPVFDYLRPGGYFKRKEAEITALNEDIVRFEKGPLAQATADYQRAKQLAESRYDDYRQACRHSKQAREAKRRDGASESELAAMTKQSQFEKAELRRLKKRLAAELQPAADLLESARRNLQALKQLRHDRSEALQKWLFTNFRLLNARGETRSLSEIFADTPTDIPPSGAGECCAPKLLQEAYRRGWKPTAIAEYWYGQPKAGEVRIHGRHYPACRGKCLPILRWMLKGLDVDPPLDASTDPLEIPEPEIIFENEWFCVVNKPAGMLTIPGKGHAISLQEWLEQHYGPERMVRPAHRLDRDTSGLLIATFGPLALKTMHSLFATRKVRKTYLALLEGDYRRHALPPTGRIDLPLSPDLLDRPRQRVDPDGGKQAITLYEMLRVIDGHTLVRFRPLTGRTHQLRIHAASPHGLSLPILGDPLYAPSPTSPSTTPNLPPSATPNLPPSAKATPLNRMYLHSFELTFTFPLDGRPYTFTLPPPFPIGEGISGGDGCNLREIYYFCI